MDGWMNTYTNGAHFYRYAKIKVYRLGTQKKEEKR
jgi:hypothetical protein